MSTSRTAVAAVVAAAAVGSIATYGVDAAGPKVFEARLDCCKQTVLGPQSNPTHIMDSPKLPLGTYLVTMSVGAVMGREDIVVCQAGTTAGGTGYGTAGNGSQTSGQGPAGVYGTANFVDVLRVTVPNERIQLWCNANGSKGTYVGGGTLTATKLGSAVLEVH